MKGLIGNCNASAWARSFVKQFPDWADESTMLCWFATAIMTGYDEGIRKGIEQEKERIKLAKDAKRNNEKKDN